MGWLLLLAVAFLGWQVLLLIGKLWGTNGVFLVLMLGFAALVIVIYGGLASIAFALKLPLAGWALMVLMIGQLLYLAWSTFDGLR
jgi:hypothetical protein